MDRSPFLRSLRFLDRKVSRAIRDFRMLEEHDRVLVAVSGGKDSLVLLHVLAVRRRWRPEPYRLVACHIDDGVCEEACGFSEALERTCDELDVPLRVVEARTIPSPEEVATGVSPCFVCARRRRRALLETAVAEGCRSVALGHHQDDLAETALLNLMWQGRYETMPPRRDLFDGEVAIVRPLALVPERDIRRAARLGALPVHRCACDYAAESKRELARDLLQRARAAGCRKVGSTLAWGALASSTETGQAPGDSAPRR